MKSNGSLYVVVVAAVLVVYFAYQSWYNPKRAIRLRLEALAETLSVPAGQQEADIGRVGRLGQLRTYFADDVRVQADGAAPAITSRDQLIAAIAGFTAPPGGWIVEFVDEQITVDSDSTAHVYLTAKVSSRDSIDAREAQLALSKRDAGWVITDIEPEDTLQK